MSDPAYRREYEGPVEGAVERLRAELQERGFGILAALPVHEILREKLGAEIDPVVILDVCAPKHALRALTEAREVALWLPSKIVVSREAGRTRIAMQRPTQVLAAFLPRPGLEALAEEVERSMRAAVDATASAPSAPEP